MTTLSRGANASLVTGRVDVAVAGARQGAVDLMVFQLDADRRVRNDADFVFFNQPVSPEGAVRLVAADRIAVDLSAVPAVIVTLAVAVALDDSVAGSLAGITGLGVTLSGSESHRADASGLTVERAAVLIEIYRRAGGWKVRNVSAGWAAGLSALVAEHGVTVDDAPVGPEVALPPAVLPQRPPRSGPPPAPARSAPPSSAPPDRSLPMPGGFPPPGGSLPPPVVMVPPRPGGWPAPGGSLTGR